ncbi:hypothetical protein [Kitasatospora sp. NPDC057223]|jgi:hypothetical protein|uniref:hypothetical protein n=1 Tax=Kitasatospora sp. NPDC057223 TaxID=3346055 RepID=UPI003636F2FA
MFGRKSRGSQNDEALAALIADARRWDGGRHARRAEQPLPLRDTTAMLRERQSDR